MLGRQKQKKDSRSAKTGLTGPETGLTDPSGNFAKIPRNKKKGRPSFEELLAKSKERGANPKQNRRPSKAKDTNLSLGHCEQPGFCPRQGNHVVAPYLDPRAPTGSLSSSRF